MSGTEDCASQEIEASTSSNSTRNSMKCTFVQSILNAENSHIASNSGPMIIFGRERVSELPVLEKTDFINNWIVAHSCFVDPPEKSSPGSPILGLSTVKRSPQSPVLGYQWKRVKREASSKENCRVSLNKKFQKVGPNPLVTARTTLDHEICSNNDEDKTLSSANFSVLKKITNSPIFNTSKRSGRFGVTKNPSNFDADSTLNLNDRKSLVRDNTEIPETLSLSSPLCKRNNPFKIVDALNYPKQTIEALNKQLIKDSELLVEESPYDDEVISSSSKILETISHSTIGDEYGELKADLKKDDLAKYDFQVNEHINRLERLHHSPSSSSSIKIEAETSSDHDRCIQDQESSNSSVRLSIPSPLKKKKLIGGKSCNASWVRAKTSHVKFETVGTLQEIDNLKKIQQSSSIPDTLSVSSQLQESLVPESLNSLYRLSTPTSLRRKEFIDIKFNNTPWIRAKNSSINSEAIGTLHRSEQSKKNWASSQIPDTLSVSSQLPENLVNKFSNSPGSLTNHSLLRRKKFIGLNSKNTSWTKAKNCPIKSGVVATLQGFEQLMKVRQSLQLPDTLSVSSQLDEILVPEPSESPNMLSPSTLLHKNVHVGIISVDPPMMTLKDSSMTSEVVASANCDKDLIKIGESFKLLKTLSERIDVESSTTNAPEDDVKIESASDCTMSDFIENPVTQNVAAFGNVSTPAKSASLEDRSQDLDDRLSKCRQDRFCDSDETYYSDGDSIPQLRITNLSPHKNSQQISQSTSQSHESRIISQAPSPLGNKNREPPSNVMSLHTMNNNNNNNNKKKKGKKGSLVAKLQTIVNSQVSKLRIWRYQMSQPDFKNVCVQLVKVKIRERETRYGRHYLTASVIEDTHDLLKRIFDSESNLSSEKDAVRSEISIVTLMLIPEIIGVVKIPAQSTLKIYPPWEIMDRSRKILNVMFFNVDATEDTNVDNKNVINRGSKNVIEEFECPCIQAKTLVDSCRVKFSNIKTGVMQEMFNSRNEVAQTMRNLVEI